MAAIDQSDSAGEVCQRLAACEQRIDYVFGDKSFLRSALTHASGAEHRLASNERLEFLGDAILGAVVCDLLYRLFPEYLEGDLTKIKSAVVSRKTCARFSTELGLGNYLFLGKGVSHHGEIPSNMLADVFEALVAAIFLDGGWTVAKEFVLRFIEPEIQRMTDSNIQQNAKSQLQQVVQRLYGGPPRYFVLDEQGPDHDKCFKVVADVDGHRFPPAWGRNKKEAELKAAHNGLAEINHEPIPFPSN